MPCGETANTQKALAHPTLKGLCQGPAPVWWFELGAELAAFFTEHHLYSKELLADKSQWSRLGFSEDIFTENEWCRSVALKTTTEGTHCQGRHSGFQRQKWNTSNGLCECNSFQTQFFSDELSGDIKNGFVYAYNGMHHLLEDLQNPVNRYFPNDQCMIL